MSKNDIVLVLNVAVYEKLDESKKTVFLYEWLRKLDDNLPTCSQSTINMYEEELSDQLMTQIKNGPGPPIRKHVCRCLGKLYAYGNPSNGYNVVDNLHELLKGKLEGQSASNSRLCAISALGFMHFYLGKSIDGSVDSSTSLFCKMLKNSDSQMRREIMLGLSNLVAGSRSLNNGVIKDIWKVTKNSVVDRAMIVRIAALECMHQLILQKALSNSNDLENAINLCIRSFDNSNSKVRMEASKLLAFILLLRLQMQTVNNRSNGVTVGSVGVSSSISNLGSSNLPNTPLPGSISSGALTNSINQSLGSGMNSSNTNSSAGSSSAVVEKNSNKNKYLTINDAIQILSSGFWKGAGGFLKGSSASDVIKGVNSVNREIRLGMTYSFVEFFNSLGAEWILNNISLVLTSCLNLLLASKSMPTQNEAIFARHCVRYIILTVLRRKLSDEEQMRAATSLLQELRNHLNLPNEESSSSQHKQDENTHKQSSINMISAVSGGISPNNSYGDDIHWLVCAFDILNQLIIWLDSISASLSDHPVFLYDCIFTALSHSSTSVRLAAASCLKQLAVVLPQERISFIHRCIHHLHIHKTNADVIQGYSAAIAGIFAGSRLAGVELPLELGNQVFGLAEEFIRSAYQNSRLTKCRTQAGWMLVGGCLCLGGVFVRQHLPRMLMLWRNAFPRSGKELEAEKQRGDAFTWQVMLEARVGALCSIQAFLMYGNPNDEAIKRILSPIECALNLISNLPDILRSYQLKSVGNILRLRLYKCMLLLPPKVFHNAYSPILRELVAEFTLNDTSVNTTASLYEFLCQTEDSVLSSTLRKNECYLEDQFQANSVSSNGCGALEHDPASIFLLPMSTYSSDIPRAISRAKV